MWDPLEYYTHRPQETKTSNPRDHTCGIKMEKGRKGREFYSPRHYAIVFGFTYGDSDMGLPRTLF